MPLHEDEQGRDGNLTDDEYAATYDEGEPCHQYPPGLIESLVAKLGAKDD